MLMQGTDEQNYIIVRHRIDQNRMLEEILRSGSDSLPLWLGHLGVRAPYATANAGMKRIKCGWTQPLFRKVRNRGVN